MLEYLLNMIKLRVKYLTISWYAYFYFVNLSENNQSLQAIGTNYLGMFSV